MDSRFPERSIYLAKGRIEVQCFLADILKFVELAVLTEEASALRPVQSASSALNRTLKAVLDVLALFVHDGGDERGMDDWRIADAGKQEASSSIGDFDLVGAETVRVG